MAGNPPVVRWRALLGAALVTTAAFGVVFAHRAADEPPRDRYLVLTARVEAGELVSSASLGTVAIDLPTSVGAIAENRADTVIGRMASHTLEPSTLLSDGDLLEKGRFTEPGETEVTVSLDPTRAPVAGLAAGDVITVLATSDSGTRVVAPSARVARVDRDDPDRAIGASALIRVTLGVSDLDNATAVVDAAVTEELSVVSGAPGSGDVAEQP